MAKRFDVLTPRKKNDGGTFWHRVGTAWEGDKGINIVFDSLPMPDADGRCSVSLFEPRERDGGGNGGQRQQPRQQSGGWNDLDDEVPGF
ncbi:hypothetical protein [Sphingomonas baiyangensis]|uniref:Uncharacterized protein n=1 Tax=Sphingomonas baiyangensis TaxID=2572576 RepID=A0A4U1L0D8_9SPHN|nr:hypothetical protein [Sphingomonas baiyangensis]TKD50187.1 hypothetical protein FBR43_05035 [Sphingomonas baiyangensis]